jgi:methylthioribulose-1-phosphate dehydratase
LFDKVLAMTDPRLELIATARHFYHQGWMVGTAGNLSVRLADGSFWITGSGRSKGELLLSDFVHIYPDGHIEPSAIDVKPSSETVIHQILYHLFPEAQACYHIHSVESNLVSRFVCGEDLPLPPLEMLKGLGVWEENPRCLMPIFRNHLQVSRIATEIEARFTANRPQIPALLIRDHGLTVWATSSESARNNIELLEYICRYLVISRNLHGDLYSWLTKPFV